MGYLNLRRNLKVEKVSFGVSENFDAKTEHLCSINSWFRRSKLQMLDQSFKKMCFLGFPIETELLSSLQKTLASFD